MLYGATTCAVPSTARAGLKTGGPSRYVVSGGWRFARFLVRSRMGLRGFDRLSAVDAGQRPALRAARVGGITPCAVRGTARAG